MLLLFYILVFWLQGMWDPSSPTRSRTRTLCLGRWSLNHCTAREVPYRTEFLMITVLNNSLQDSGLFSTWLSQTRKLVPAQRCFRATLRSVPSGFLQAHSWPPALSYPLLKTSWSTANRLCFLLFLSPCYKLFPLTGRPYLTLTCPADLHLHIFPSRKSSLVL